MAEVAAPSSATTLLNDAQFLAYFLKDAQSFGEFLAGMNGRDDGAHTTLVSGHRREDDTLGKDPFLEEALTELQRQSTFPHNDRCYRRFALTSIEAKLLQAMFEEVRVFPEPLHQAIVPFQQVQCCDTRCDYRGWM